MNVTELRPGNYFVDGEALFVVIDVSLNKTAMRKMVVKLKVKNMRTGAVIETSYLGGANIELAHLDKRDMQYLYDDGNNLVFMDLQTYDQIPIDKQRMTWEANFLKGDETVQMLVYESEVLGVNLPTKVALKITSTEPAVRGDTVNKAMKDAIVETGLKVRVPLFINEGEIILVKTADGSYDSRA
jgi:elongation factor P